MAAVHDGEQGDRLSILKRRGGVVLANHDGPVVRNVRNRTVSEIGIEALDGARRRSVEVHQPVARLGTPRDELVRRRQLYLTEPFATRVSGFGVIGTRGVPRRLQQRRVRDHVLPREDRLLLGADDHHERSARSGILAEPQIRPADGVLFDLCSAEGVADHAEA